MAFKTTMSSIRAPAAAACLVAGEACGFALHAAAAAWPWMAALLALSALAVYGWNIKGMFLPLVLAAGIVLGARTEAARSGIIDGMNFCSQPEARQVRVESPVKAWKAKKFPGVSVDFLSHVGPIPVKVVMPLADGERLPSQGETWLCRGRLSCRQAETDRFAMHTLWIRDASHARRVVPAENSVFGRYARTGAFLAEQASMGLEWNPELAGLNQAILLGRRSGMTRSRRETFSMAGTMHVFAISGLHVMVIAMALKGLLEKLDVPLAARGLVAIPALAAYVMLTGMRPSAVRAAVMTSLYLLAPVFKRRHDMLAAWSLTAIMVYGISPEKVFDIGCALSFTVMLGIVLWIRWTSGFAPVLPQGSRFRKLPECLGISLAAWVAGVPVSAHVFGMFSLGGLVVNAAVVACAQWVVRFGAFGIAASAVCMPLAAISNNLAALCTALMALASELVAAVPFASVATPRWSVLHSAAWYGAWIAAFAAAGRFLPRKRAKSDAWWL